MQQRFLLQILLLAQHVSGTTIPIIRSSRVLYSGCCLWYFMLWFSRCWSGVELRVMCPKHVEQAIRSAIKTSAASSWHYFHILTTMHGQNLIKFNIQKLYAPPAITFKTLRFAYKAIICLHTK